MAKWKTQCNRKVRKSYDLEDGGYYKKAICRWMAPDDGKHYWDDPKARRK